MESYDSTAAAKVWQRVFSEPAAQTQDLTPLIAGEMTDEATYLSLAKRFKDSRSQLLRQMAAEEKTHSACLRGICRLRTGSPAQARIPEPSDAPAEVLLRRCYSREMKCLAQYRELSSDPEFGEVFCRLAEQERKHCQQLLELLGTLRIP